MQKNALSALKIIALGLVLAFSLSGSSAYAQTTPAPTTPTVTAASISSSILAQPTTGSTAVTAAAIAQVGASTFNCNGTTMPNTPGGQQTCAAAQQNAKNAASGANCSIFNVNGWFTLPCMANFVATIAYIIMSIAGFVLGLVGLVFNWIVVITIFQFGAFFGNSPGLLLGWGIVRDIGNILVLFGFVYIGVMMILDLHSFNARQAIPRLILFAILLNFSLFISEAIVDLSNVLSASIYQQAGTSEFTVCNNLSSCTNTSGIAEVILQDSYVGTSFSIPTQAQTTQTVKTIQANPFNQLLAYTGTTIFITIALMVLIAACIMFFTRALTLVVLFILSPIAFAGMAIPQLANRTKQWWDTLLANAFFAPLFLLILLAGLKVLDGFRGSLGNGSTSLATALATPGTSVGTIFIVFGMVIGVMILALMFAKNSGVAGAQFATGFAQKTVNSAWKAAAFPITRPVQIGARNVTGAAGTKFRESYNRWMGNLEHKGGFSKTLAGVVRGVGADDAIMNATQRARTAKFGEGVRTFEEEEKHAKERRDTTRHASEEQRHEAHLEDALKMEATTEEQKLERAEAIQRAELTMTTDHLKKVLSKYVEKGNDEYVEAMASNMSKRAFGDIMKDDHFDPKVRESIKNNYFKPLRKVTTDIEAATATLAVDPDNAAAKAALGEARDKLRDEFTPDDIGTFVELDTENGSRLANLNNLDNGDSVISTDQYEKGIKNNGSLPPALRKRFQMNQQSGQLIQAIKEGTPERVRNIANAMGAKLGDMPVKVLGNDQVIDALNPDALQSIMSKTKFNSTEESKAIKAKIVEAIKKEGHDNYEDIKKWLGKEDSARNNYWS